MRLLTASARSVVGCLPVGDDLIIADVRGGRQPRVQALHRVRHPGEEPAPLRRMARSLKLHNRPWVWIMPEGSYQLLLVDVPDVPAEDVKSALQLKVKDLISFPLAEASVDILFLPEEAFRGRNRMAFALVARREDTEPVEDLFGRAGLRLHRISAADLAYRNLLHLVSENAAAALLTMRENDSALSAVFADDLCLVRAIPITAGELASPEQDATPEADTEPDTTGSYDFDLELSADDLAQSNEEQEDPLTRQLDTLALELQRSFDYFDTQLGLGRVAELRIMARHELPEQVYSSMNTRFDLHAAPLALEEHIALAPDVATDRLEESAVAIGGALYSVESSAHAEY